MSPAWYRGALAALLLLIAPAVGAAVALSPKLALPTLGLMAAVGFAATSSRIRMPLASAAFAGIFAFHVVTELRYTWLSIDYFPASRVLRAAVGLGLPVALIGPGLLPLVTGAARRILLSGVLYSLWTVLASQWGSDPGHSTFYGLWLLLILIDLNLCLALIDDLEEFWARFLAGLVALAVVVSAASLLAGVAGVQLAQSSRYGTGGIVVGYQGLFKNPNILGAQAALGVAAALGLRALRPAWTPRSWLWGAVSLCTLAAVASVSRAAILAIAIAGTYDFVASTSRDRRGAVLGRIVLAALLFAGVARTDFATETVARVTSTRTNVSTGDELRVHIWRSYLRGFAEHPIVGLGFGQSALADDYVTRRFGADEEMDGHSVLMSYGLATGIPGMLLFGWVLAQAGAGLRRLRGTALRQSVVVVLAAMSPMFLATTIALPGSWGPFVFWTPVVFLGVLGARGGVSEPSDEPA
jgi:O-antigen ligase